MSINEERTALINTILTDDKSEMEEEEILHQLLRE